MSLQKNYQCRYSKLFERCSCLFCQKGSTINEFSPYRDYCIWKKMLLGKPILPFHGPCFQEQIPEVTNVVNLLTVQEKSTKGIPSPSGCTETTFLFHSPQLTFTLNHPVFFSVIEDSYFLPLRYPNSSFNEDLLLCSWLPPWLPCPTLNSWNNLLPPILVFVSESKTGSSYNR